ncbi:uncharacterized protein LOC143569344 [Bidens hawaiensis]|uniref:uncharacterized protein LOC143569344 n=1 Tax=Bidens hawaiensis TaxID=980011 RepID=UPI004049B802
MGGLIEAKIIQFDDFVDYVEEIIKEAISKYEGEEGVRQAKLKWESRLTRYANKHESSTGGDGVKVGDTLSKEKDLVSEAEKNPMFETTQVSCSLVEHVNEVEMNALKSGKKFKTTPPVDRPSFDLMMSQLTPIEYQDKTTPSTPVCPIPYNVQVDVPIQGHEKRPAREVNLPDNMRSPYANKKVMLDVKRRIMLRAPYLLRIRMNGRCVILFGSGYVLELNNHISFML